MNGSNFFIGCSESGIEEAILNALHHAGNPAHFEVIETLGCRDNGALCHYKAILKTLSKEGI